MTHPPQQQCGALAFIAAPWFRFASDVRDGNVLLRKMLRRSSGCPPFRHQSACDDEWLRQARRRRGDTTRRTLLRSSLSVHIA
jgi:hypothetical protein